jgi:mono/diheme cytochrome c family protein
MKTFLFLMLSLTALFIVSCGGSDKPAEDNVDRGVGPVKTLELGPLDEAMATEGQAIFTTKCSACHKLDQKYVGPSLNGVTSRRSPEWIMNMILNPDRMTKENAAAKELFATYMTQMTNQNIKKDEARKILEYFRKNDGQK